MTNVLVNGLRIASAAVLAAIAVGAHAFDLTLEVGDAIEYTNNTALTPNNEISEWIQTPEAAVTIKHDSDALSASADYSVSHSIHQRDTFNDQTNTVGNGLLTWRAIPDRLTFDLSNANTLTTINSQAADTPTNQQVINTTIAGTTLTLPGYGSHKIELHYDYSWVNAHDTMTDSKRQTGTAAYIIPLSTVEQIQLNASTSDVKFDNSKLSPDYVSYSGNLQYVRGGDWIEVDTQMGYTVFDRTQGAKNASAITGDLNLTWHVSEVTTVKASYARSLEDQSQDLATGIPAFGQTVTENTNVTTPYTLDATSLSFTTPLGHNIVDLTGYIDNQEYENGSQNFPTTQPDQKTKGVTLGISRPLRPTLNARMFGDFSTTDYKDNGNQHNYDAGLRFDWTRWRDLTISAGTFYRKRTSDIATDEYTEWVGSISLMYMLIGTRR